MLRCFISRARSASVGLTNLTLAKPMLCVVPARSDLLRMWMPLGAS